MQMVGYIPHISAYFSHHLHSQIRNTERVKRTIMVQIYNIQGTTQNTVLYSCTRVPIDIAEEEYDN